MAGETKKELVEQFVKNAEAVIASVEVIPADASLLNAALQKQIAEEESVLFTAPNDVDSNLFTEFLQNEKIITDPNKEQFKHTRLGITDAFCGIASTGSVCVPVVESITSVTTMLTRKHVVVLNSNSILPRPRDVFSEDYLDGEGLKRSFSFITGPSATADMGPLVRGVHGPGYLHIIVLD